MFIYKGIQRNGKYYLAISSGKRDPITKKVKNIHIKKYGTHDLNTKEG